MGQQRDHLAAEWSAAINRPEVRAALESIYTAAGAAIAARGPACWASGRCCHFEKHGHRLYVTGLEAAYCITMNERTDKPGPAADTHASLTLPQLRNDCPFQVANLCSVHTIKPLGCRIYFCDRSAQDWQQDLSELLLARIRDIHDRFAVEYRYGEWREMLARFGLP